MKLTIFALLCLGCGLTNAAKGYRGKVDESGGTVTISNNESERELTFEIAAGKEECFFEYVEKGHIIDLEYQVIDGGQSNDMRIDFRLERPNGVPIVVDYAKSDTGHRNLAEESGDYKICFDNSKARFGSKIVYFGVIIENEVYGDYIEVNQESEEFYGDEFKVKVSDIEKSLGMIRERMSRSRHLQDQLKAFEFRDRSIAEHNFERINFWSTLQVIVMLAAGLIQVVLVRSIFDDKSAIHKIWKGH